MAKVIASFDPRGNIHALFERALLGAKQGAASSVVVDYRMTVRVRVRVAHPTPAEHSNSINLIKACFS